MWNNLDHLLPDFEMDNIKFSTKEKEVLVQKIQTYMQKEFDLEITRFDAEFLLDFISREFGSIYYNRGLYDAQSILSKKIDEISESILTLEK